MKRVRVGLVGCGGVAQMMHLPYLRELDGLFEIAALCDLSPGVLRSVGDHYGVAARYTDFHELVARDLAAVLVLTPGSPMPPRRPPPCTPGATCWWRSRCASRCARPTR